jgi:uncharacterized protein (TIGR03435 family)
MRKCWIVYALMVGVSAFAQTDAKAKAPQFDVVSMKVNQSGEERGFISISPGGDRLIVKNAPMYRIVEFAFNFKRHDLIVGTPAWTRTDNFDIEATVAAADLPAFRALTFEQQERMLQPVLTERCAMQAHVEKRDTPVFALQIAKGGLKMREVKPKEGWDVIEKHGEIHGRGVPIMALLYALANVPVERQVVDQTGLTAAYDFDLIWTPAEDPAGEDAAARPSLFTAVEEQLGLRLVATRALVDALVVEHIERPTAN